MVEIYVSEIKERLSFTRLEYYWSVLPEREQIKNKRYLRWEDQQAHLFGKLLLRSALIKYGFSDQALTLIQFNDHQKPFIEGNVYFNISHSGKYVACAISKGIKMGLDVEQKIPQPDMSDFREIFSQAEWDYLNSVEEKIDVFYKLWTRKESIIKANGRGLSIPLQEVDVLSKSVWIEDTRWYITDLELDTAYSASLATGIKDSPVHFVPLNF